MKPESAEQLTFDFAGRRISSRSHKLHPMDMRRAVLGWIIPQRPDGIGVMVPTRISRYQADVAAFWSKANAKKLFLPEKTMIIEIRHDREQCWPDCARQNELLPLMKMLKQEKAALESEIRRKEPHLRDGDNLFGEYQNWRYRESGNRDYIHCCRKIEQTEHSLYKGSRFEQIRRAKVADLLYLAVPQGTIHPDELAEGWGLLEIENNLNVRENKVAENRNCAKSKRVHFVQNIAMSCRNSILFAHGIKADKNGQPVFTPVPRRRRIPQS